MNQKKANCIKQVPILYRLCMKEVPVLYKHIVIILNLN